MAAGAMVVAAGARTTVARPAVHCGESYVYTTSDEVRARTCESVCKYVSHREFSVF